MTQANLKRVKVYPDGNEFILTKSGMWIRNFTKSNVQYTDMNQTYNQNDYFTFLKNEIQNSMQKYPWVNNENYMHDKVMIVSDGFNFAQRQKFLAKIPSGVTVIGVLGALNKWSSSNKNMNYYVINNPYKECLKYLGRRGVRTFPKCVASLKTNSDFLSNYRGNIYKYLPVYEKSYSSRYTKETDFQVDDYRNPVCAAIHLAYSFNAEKIMLYCCDDSFEGQRPGAEKLENGLYQYPQHNIAHEMIDAKMFWLKNLPYQEIKLFYHSSGPRYENATYIEEEEIFEVMR